MSNLATITVRLEANASKFKKNDQKSDLMMSCHACKTYVHESLVIQNKGLYFCSKECANL